MDVTVPGSILLLGEYAILEEGGLGLAMAVERRVRVTTIGAEGLSVEGLWQGGALAWTPRDPSASPLVAAVVEVVEKWLQDAGAETRPWSACVRLDSSALFSSEGRKSGLGSSAAVTVGLVCALLAAAGRPDRAAKTMIPLLATRAHRMAQGGRGSGYDISCSFHGGMGIFHGGALPSWEPCRLREDYEVFLYPGPSPVSSSEAIRRYALWKEKSPGAARAFLEESNRSVMDFIKARSTAEAEQRLRTCRKLGREVGEAIGVPADIEPPPGLDPSWCKALGAGNELGACLLPGGAPDHGENIQRVRMSEEGVVWRE
jgi:phosphomevalonate kinase